MELFVSEASPFARKARIVAREKGLMDRVREVFLNPHESPPDLLAVNPVSRIPALRKDDGICLIGSSVICAYLDQVGAGPRLGSNDPDDYILMRNREALADELLSAAVSRTVERWRPQEQQSAHWLSRWEKAIYRGLSQLEADVEDRNDVFDISSIAVGCLLAYLDFRHPDLNWRGDHRRLTEWLSGVECRASFQATLHPA